jgi:hypothetical protein
LRKYSHAPPLRCHEVTVLITTEKAGHSSRTYFGKKDPTPTLPQHGKKSIALKRTIQKLFSLEKAVFRNLCICSATTLHYVPHTR